MPVISTPTLSPNRGPVWVFKTRNFLPTLKIFPKRDRGETGSTPQLCDDQIDLQGDDDTTFDALHDVRCECNLHNRRRPADNRIVLAYLIALHRVGSIKRSPTCHQFFPRAAQVFPVPGDHQSPSACRSRGLISVVDIRKPIPPVFAKL